MPPEATPPPCSNEVWCFIISVKINYTQGEIFLTPNISMPSRAQRHPSPRARQEASGTTLFSILSPCKCLHKLILNSSHKNSRRELGKSLHGIWSPVRGTAVGGGVSPTPGCIRSPQRSVRMPRGGVAKAKVTSRQGWDVPKPPTATCPATDGWCGSSPLAGCSLFLLMSGFH